ncbi:unnamed protein product, partial [Allacma fusca]
TKYVSKVRAEFADVRLKNYSVRYSDICVVIKYLTGDCRRIEGFCRK